MLTRALMLRWSLMLSALVALSACGGSQRVAPEQTTPEQAVSIDVNGFIQEVLAGAQAYAYDDVVSMLGRPARVKAMPLAGPSGSAPPDTVRTLIYYGLEVGLREGAASSRLVHLALTDARYTSPEGVRVGYAESQVLSTLGLPTRRAPAQLIYEKESPQHGVLLIYLERRAVSRMEWRFDSK